LFKSRLINNYLIDSIHEIRDNLFLSIRLVFIDPLQIVCKRLTRLLFFITTF